VQGGELDRDLVRGQEASAVGSETLEVEVTTIRLGDDLRARHLAEPLMRAREHARRRDAGEPIDARLHFFGEDLEPGHEDHRLLPATQVQRAVLVEPPDVARGKPAADEKVVPSTPRPVVRGEEAGAADGDLARPIRPWMRSG